MVVTKYNGTRQIEQSAEDFSTASTYYNDQYTTKHVRLPYNYSYEISLTGITFILCGRFDTLMWFCSQSCYFQNKSISTMVLSFQRACTRLLVLVLGC